ncbi:hypothetical protein NLU13_1439 [Sarocladium strictum]|uniref:RING-type domain-containing protein n=1 Tax=Sarocladium strictum TaxID=5046 RepID=A0AA39GR90_SARSR|nr:hypothetical protein NLU13_1439 [Sarocladium strictum]
MSLSEIRNVVLLFSNPVWSGGSTIPTTIIRNISSQTSQLAYEERLKSNITTLTTTNAETLNGVITGLLYVPEIRNNPECASQQYDFIPRNVTRRSDLPPVNYPLVAFAPWFSIECTKAYLASARRDPIRAFIFYKPNNSSNKPQDVDSPVWNLDDNGLWQRMNPFPIFAVSGQEGQKITTKLSHYSGNISEVPHGDEIQSIYSTNPKDYVRIFTELTMEDRSTGPALWAYFLIVIGALLLIFTSVSLAMHLIQRRRRSSLRKRVESGEVDLEAMGIKRVVVPPEHVKSFPLFTYQAEPDGPPTPMGPGGGPLGSRSARASRRQRRAEQAAASDAASQVGGRSVRTLRSKRSSVACSVDTTATNDQPKCQICLDPFEHRVSIIREMACGHIFHPECIDEYLTKNSSLCPICMQNMLPAGYSPKITNAMVRRERNLRRLRQRINIDDASLESGYTKMDKLKRLFKSSSAEDSPSESSPVALTPVQKPTTPPAPIDTRQESIPEEGTASSPDSEAAITPSNDAQAGTSRPKPSPPSKPPKPRTRKTRPRALNLLPTQPEDGELKATQAVGRKSPSSFARQRMREIAHRNAPIDDPDRQSIWRAAVNKVFPGLT